MDYLKDLNKKQVDAKSIIEELLSGKKYYFAELKPSELDARPGVYAIFDKDSGENLYVGRTKNLRQRLYTNHLMGSMANARLKKYLVEDKDPCMTNIVSMDDAKQFLKDHCYFQCIQVEDVKRRGQIEGMLSFFLDVRYMHEEH